MLLTGMERIGYLLNFLVGSLRVGVTNIRPPKSEAPLTRIGCMLPRKTKNSLKWSMRETLVIRKRVWGIYVQYFLDPSLLTGDDILCMYASSGCVCPWQMRHGSYRSFQATYLWCRNRLGRLSATSTSGQMRKWVKQRTSVPYAIA